MVAQSLTMAQTGFPLPLRNALAELIIAGLDDPTAASAVAWLTTAAPPPPASVVDRLAAVHLLDRVTLDLIEVHRPWLDAMREHAGRGHAAHTRYRQAPAVAGSLVDVAVVKSAALWNERLFFEVHEVLEFEWKRTTGPVRTALQGLIQMGVAFHHLKHGNVRGARSLFHDGRERLTVASDALDRLDTPALLAATAGWEDAVAAGEWPGAPPPLPLRPTNR